MLRCSCRGRASPRRGRLRPLRHLRPGRTRRKGARSSATIAPGRSRARGRTGHRPGRARRHLRRLQCGVIEYDGATWRLIETPTIDTVRSLDIDANGRIYALRLSAGLPLTDIASAAVEAIDRFAGSAPQFDDITMLMVRRLT